MAEKAELEVLDPPVDARHRFQPIRYYDTDWDLTHLDSFAFKADIGFEATVVVIFSCHCFSHSFRWEPRPRAEIPDIEIYKDEKEERVLNPERYRLSRTLLRKLMVELPWRHIIVANVSSCNFMTWEIQTDGDKPSVYAVFFDVEKDQHRKHRIILRIQSAYILDKGLTRRQKDAKKVRFTTLIKAAHEGRTIKP